MKKSIALLLTMALLLMAGCVPTVTESTSAPVTTPSSPVSDKDLSVGSGKLFDKPVKLTKMAISHPSWPHQEDWLIIDLIEEATNVQLEVIAIPSAGYNDRLNLDLASGELCDIINISGTDITHKYGPQGAFVNIKDQLNNLPNYKKFYEQNTEDVMRFMTADGNWYNFHNSGIGETNRQGWMYRKDIFDKHNLAIPTNEQELYDVLKALKALYPDSYPFMFRQNLIRFSNFGPAWGTGWEVYYNFESNEWRYGPIEDNFKEMAMYLYKLYQEELIPPDWLSIETSVYDEMVVNDKGFILFEYLPRIDSYATMAKESNPGLSLAFMPPIATEKGVSKLTPTGTSVAGFTINAKSPVVNEALKYVDWFYSEEAMELVSWGKEGVTYKVENGKRKYIDAEDMTQVRQKYGLATNGFYTRYDFGAQVILFSDALQYAYTESKKYDLPMPPVASFTDEETTNVIQTVGTSIQDYMKENLSKFLVGVRPFDEWDQYVEELKRVGVDELVELYKISHARILK